jgi:hypothetical protein
LAKGDSEQTWYLTFQQPQTIYKNTFAAMAETIPDQNIINKFPLSTQHPEISVFNETMERCKGNLTPDEHKRRHVVIQYRKGHVHVHIPETMTDVTHTNDTAVTHLNKI